MIENNNSIMPNFDYPIDKDNEALIAANIIKNAENRNFFVKQGNWQSFRYKEFQTISWSVIEAENEKLSIDPDIILLKSKSCPVRYLVTFEFLNELITNFNEVPLENFKTHIEKLVVDKVKADILERTSSIVSVCTNPATKLSSIDERLNYLKEIVGKGFSSSKLEFKGMEELVPEYLLNKETLIHKYTTGFKQLDAILTTGFAPGEVTAIAGLASMGKSSAALSIMKNLANKKIYTAQFALEMNRTPLLTKLLSFNSRISIKHLIDNIGTFSEDEKNSFYTEAERLKRNKYIYLDDKPMQSIKSMREQIMLLQDHIKQEYIVVVVDLFGKIKEFQSSDNFARDYEKNANKMQQMVKELGIHAILVTQIRKDVATRKFSRPTMNDLKNAGALTEISDIILGIHRPYYNPEMAMKSKLLESIKDEEATLFNEEQENMLTEENMNKNLAEIIIMKQRMGENNVMVNFIFDPDTTCFVPIDHEHQKEINKSKTDLLGEMEI